MITAKEAFDLAVHEATKRFDLQLERHLEDIEATIRVNAQGGATKAWIPTVGYSGGMIVAVEAKLKKYGYEVRLGIQGFNLNWAPEQSKKK